MSHTCSTLIICCMDFRLTGAVYEFAQNKGLNHDYDLISVGGSIKSLVKPKNENDVDFLIRQIDISVNLHQIKNVIIIAHEDCGAYGGKKAFESDQKEVDEHKNDTEKAKQLILEKYPKLQVEIIFAKWDDESGNSYKIE